MMRSLSSLASSSISVRHIALRRWSSCAFFRGSLSRLAMVDRALVSQVLPCTTLKVSATYDSRPRRNYRREPRPSVSELDLEEEVSRIDMDPAKMMQPADPGAMQAVIKEVMPVGYFCTLPSGRIGYLPAQDLGFTGGLAILQRLFKEGQEITVRIVCRGGAGREIISCKKPEFAPPSEQKTIESLRLHFENEKKNMGRPRRR
ncbi:hypothetical protein GOP47_0028414 [Adiantum capillus-veneris]|nr:hypothetical protein GOP47_0028414 [Adiantum capillus-veneris]